MTTDPTTSANQWKPSVLDLIRRHRVIPVVVLHDAGRAAGLAEALVVGGLPLAEVAFRTPAALAALRILAADSRLTVGAGTVLTTAQVDQAADAGASFVVSPGLSAAVVRRCRERKLPVIPGISSATELMTALDLGIDVAKFFPAETCGGAAAVAALAGPFPHVRFVPTGGIGPANIADYLQLPAVLAVGASWMVPSAHLAAGRFGDIAQLATDCARFAVADGPGVR